MLTLNITKNYKKRQIFSQKLGTKKAFFLSNYYCYALNGNTLNVRNRERLLCVFFFFKLLSLC